MISKKHIEAMAEEYKECLKLQREVISMQYSGKEDEMDKAAAAQNRDSGAPASRNVFDEEWEKN